MKLYLAPMEGVGDRAFRKAMASIGGFDEAVTDFIRVPSNAHVKSLARVYEYQETAPIPLAAQIMGSDTDLMADMCRELVERGAPRIDLNCGCPSNTVTGRGAGSSLLKDPKHLYEVAASMVKAVELPVSLKMRSGFSDISLFKENLMAAQESGVVFITLHPRTKVDGYGPPARWDLIAEAKSLLSIPLVGNGDILNRDDARRMVAETNCDALMIGRGAVINPFVFHEVKASFDNTVFSLPGHELWAKLENFIKVYISEFPVDMSERGRVNKLKQLFGFWFKRTPQLLEQRQDMLTYAYKDEADFLNYCRPRIEKSFVETPLI